VYYVNPTDHSSNVSPPKDGIPYDESNPGGIPCFTAPLMTFPFSFCPSSLPVYAQNQYYQSSSHEEIIPAQMVTQDPTPPVPSKQQWEGVLKQANPVNKTRAKWWWLLQAERTKLNVPFLSPAPISESNSQSAPKLPPRSKLKDLLQWAQNAGVKGKNPTTIVGPPQQDVKNDSTS